jgi:hypothetical protein
MHRLFVLAALLATNLAVAETKVSGGGTPPASRQAAPAADKGQAAPDSNRRDAAKKALGAIKGDAGKDKRGTAGDAKAGR